MRFDRPLFISHLVGLPAPEVYLGRPSEGWILEAGAVQRRLAPASPTDCLALLDRALDEWPEVGAEAVFLGTARGALSPLLTVSKQASSGEMPDFRSFAQTSHGALASHVARRLRLAGPALTVSQTCVSGLAALYMAALFLLSGGGEAAVFGAVESPLHPLFIQSFQHFRLYTKRQSWPFTIPFGAANTLALAEAVVLGRLSTRPSPFRLEAVALSVEPAETYTAFSVRALQHVLHQLEGFQLDGVLLHAPGTRQGDLAEVNQVQAVWGACPLLSFKTFTGHSVGASGLQGLQLAAWLLERQAWLLNDEGISVAPPDASTPAWSTRQGFVAKLVKPMQRLAVLGAGFGGAAAGVIVSYEP